MEIDETYYFEQSGYIFLSEHGEYAADESTIIAAVVTEIHETVFLCEEIQVIVISQQNNE